MIISFIKKFIKQKFGFEDSQISGRPGGYVTLYVHEGGRNAIDKAWAIGADRLVYEYGEFDPPKRIECKKKTISDDPSNFFRWNKKVIELAREYVEGMLGANCGVALSKDFETFKKHLIGFFQIKLSADIRFLILVEDENNVVLSVDYPSVIRKIFHNGRVIGTEFLSYFVIVRNCAHIILYLLRGAFNFWKKKLEARHLLIPVHQSVDSNPEFFSLHNSIEDSIVLADERGELFKHLLQTGAKVLPESQLYITPRQFFSSVRLSIFLFSQVPRDYRSPFLLQAISDYIKQSAQILAYYNSVSVKFIGIVRGDMYPTATLLRKISASVGVITYSCSHTVYFYREYYFCSTDFDWYGWSGENEKQVGAELLNESTKSINVGQLTSEYRNRNKTNRWEIDNPQCSHVACVYPTSICDYVVPNTASIFSDFIEATCASCKNMKDVLVFYKSKQTVKKQRGDSVDPLQILNDLDAVNRMEQELGANFQVLDEHVTVYDTYDNIDIGFVFSMTTVAFELLQNKKKVLVYWPFNTVSHPFSLHTPLLVASSISDFVEKAKKLQDMPYLEYEEYILPTLQYCLICPDSSSMVGRFIQQIENN